MFNIHFCHVFSLAESLTWIGFPGFDSLEDARAFCEKNARDVEQALHPATGERIAFV
jgi:hypothetical protein